MTDHTTTEPRRCITPNCRAELVDNEGPKCWDCQRADATEGKPLFQCICGSDTELAEFTAGPRWYCNKCGTRYSPDARDGLSLLRSEIVGHERASESMVRVARLHGDEIRELRESQRLADENNEAAEAVHSWACHLLIKWMGEHGPVLDDYHRILSKTSDRLCGTMTAYQAHRKGE